MCGESFEPVGGCMGSMGSHMFVLKTSQDCLKGTGPLKEKG